MSKKKEKPSNMSKNNQNIKKLGKKVKNVENHQKY